MYTKKIQEITLENRKVPVDKFAKKTFVRMFGAGTCKIRAVWEDAAGDTHAEKKDLSRIHYQEILARIDAIEISETAGAGTVIIESIYI